MTDTVAAPKTLAEKLASAKALVAKLEAQIIADAIKGDIQNGDDVDFLFGRGDSKRTLTGTVAGMIDTDQGKVVAVTVVDDTGLPDIKRVNIATLTANRTSDARRNAPAASADTDPLDAE